MKYKLNKSITAHGKEITELELDEPTAKVAIDLGFPYLVVLGEDGEGSSIKMQTKTISKYISKLAGIPPSAVETLSPSDLMGLSGEIMSFFGVAPEA